MNRIVHKSGGVTMSNCQLCGAAFDGPHVLHMLQNCRGDLLPEATAREYFAMETPAPRLVGWRRLTDLRML
jgi:hypothetical protein